MTPNGETIISIIEKNHTRKDGIIYTKNMAESLIAEIIKITSFLHEDESIPVRYFFIKNNIVDPPLCVTCNKLFPIKRIINGKIPTDSCSVKCSRNSISNIEKRNKTNLERYGVENPFGATTIKEKIKQTNIERYGVENPLHSSIIKDKIKKTNITKYGVENPFESATIKDKIKKTNIQKYGVEHPAQSSDIIDKMKQTNIERYGVENPMQYHTFSNDCNLKKTETVMTTYGVSNIFQVDHIKEAIKSGYLKKYGVDHPMKLTETKNKSKDTCMEKYDREYSSQKFFPDEWYDILNSKDDLQAIYDDLGIYGIISKYNISEVTVRKYLLQHNIISKATNKYQNIICNFLDQHNIEYIINDRTILHPKEIDIVIPSKKIGIELNGIYWHSELVGKNRNYHISKTVAANDNGYDLIHIWSHHFDKNPDVILSFISYKLGICSNKIYARKTTISELTNSEYNNFIDKNHIYGTANASVKLGLYYGDTLVSVMSFSKSRFNSKSQWEIVRYASLINTSVVGAASKLFAYFVKTYNPENIVSYADRDLSNGAVYKTLGFTFSHMASPNYFYFRGNRVYSRHTFQKKKLENLLETYDKTISEWDNMKNNGYNRYWNCGNSVWVWNNAQQGD